MDFTNYRPQTAALERLKNVDFIAVVGPTAVGKSTLIKLATTVEPSLHALVAGVSRRPRPKERGGIDFHFGDKDAMIERARQGGYVTVVTGVSGDLYTTAPEDYPAEGVVTMAVLADAIETFRALPFKTCRVVFVVPPNWVEWQARLRAHGFDPAQLAKRLAEAKGSLEFGLSAQDVHFVINDNIQVATQDFISVVACCPLNPRQQQDQQRAKYIINEILTKL